MKKSIISVLTVITISSITAFGFISKKNTGNDLNLVYNVDSRYANTLTKEVVHNAKLLVEILPDHSMKNAISFRNVQIDIIDKASEKGENGVLNDRQLKLLQSVDYSTDIYVKADYTIKDQYTGEMIERLFTYFITILPEKEATYKKGKNALINYLRENTKEEISIITEDRLQPGKVRFTVSKTGKIRDVSLVSTSGFPNVDDSLVKLISNMKGEWEPATNGAGDNVDQEFIFFFGQQGC